MRPPTAAGPASLWMPANLDPSNPEGNARRFHFIHRAHLLAALEDLEADYALEGDELDYIFTGPADRVAALVRALQAEGCDTLGVVEVERDADAAFFTDSGLPVDIEQRAWEP